MDVSFLPAVNATLNGITAMLLLVGRFWISRKNIVLHRRTMLTGFGMSVLFLVSYLTYHSIHGSQPFTGQGVVRFVYFSILFSHTVLAATVVPLVLITLWRGLHRDDARHRSIARWTFPIWLYVSVTGVLIYLMLYRWYAPA